VRYKVDTGWTVEGFGVWGRITSGADRVSREVASIRGGVTGSEPVVVQAQTLTNGEALCLCGKKKIYEMGRCLRGAFISQPGTRASGFDSRQLFSQQIASIAKNNRRGSGNFSVERFVGLLGLGLRIYDGAN